MRFTSFFSTIWIVQDCLDIDTRIGNRVITIARFLFETSLERQLEAGMKILR